MAQTERETVTTERMSEHEALMWNIEKDPWLNPNGASLILLDQPVDLERFTRQLRAGIARFPRLYQRVVPGLGRLSTPAWVPDPEFDLSFHLREIKLEGGGDRELLDLATRLYEEPLDRTRPLWRFVVINGIDDGRGAVYALVHHAISDGIGQLRMAEMYQQLTRDDPGADDVDLEGIIAAAAEAATSKERGGPFGSSLIDTTLASFGHIARRGAGIGQRLAGEVALWGADPSRIKAAADDVQEALESAKGALAPLAETNSSPLWSERSRRRHLEHVRLPVDALKAAGKAAGGSLNDAFLAGLAEAARRYHLDHGQYVDTFSSSYVLSTRTDNKVGGNAFTPVTLRLPAADMAPTERLRLVAAETTRTRTAAQAGGAFGGLSGLVNQLPTSVVTRAARAAAAHIDFATSNMRGAPIGLYVSGAKVLGTVCMGPVAGTAANITALSYCGNLDVGIFVDPMAIEAPGELRTHIEESFADLFAETCPELIRHEAAPKRSAKSKTKKKKRKQSKKKSASSTKNAR